MKNAKLSFLRKKIDFLDKRTAKLLKKRFDTVLAIGAYKKENGFPVLDSAREEQVLSAAERNGKAQGKSVKNVFFAILKESKSRQEDNA